MELNATKLPDFNLFTPEDLQQEFVKLFSKYQDIKLLHDEKSQKIYDLKRNLQTASAAEAYLSQELEYLYNIQNAEKDKAREKYGLEVEELKSENVRIKEENAALERQVELLRKENEAQLLQIEKLKYRDPQETAERESGPSENELQLEKDNFELLAKIDQLQQKGRQSIMQLAEAERQMEVLKEEVQCLKENLQAKKEELEEKTNILESTQGRMMDMNAELAILKSQPENENRKGNSLFAEVDDQRQALMKKLAEQKQSYLHMKKIFNESEHEIRRLKRENAAMQKELQKCTSIFLNSEKMYTDKLNERIKQLLEQNKELENKLNWTQEKLIDLSNNKGINWLDSMLAFCRNETKELKAQLHSCRLQKGILESNLRNSQQELAKWRFEALKSRCVIIDRENVLTENGIKFKDISALKFRFSKSELEGSSPQITSKESEKSFENNANHYNKENESLKENEKSLKISSNSEKEITANSHDFVKHNIHHSFDKKIDITKDSFMFVENVEVPHEVKQDKLEVNDSQDEEKERRENISFEIYEDTTQRLPTIRTSEFTISSTEEQPHFDITISENTFQELKELGHEYNARELSSREAKINPESRESVLPPGTNSFQIYEDTTAHTPSPRAYKTKSKYRIKVDDVNSLSSSFPDILKENYSSVANSLFVEDERDTQPIKSILMKKSDIFAEDSKSVRFDGSTKDNVTNSKPTKLKRPISNVVIKRITIAPRLKKE